MAPGSPDRHAAARSFACFSYCSRLAREGSGTTSCGLGYMRIVARASPVFRREIALPGTRDELRLGEMEREVVHFSVELLWE